MEPRIIGTLFMLFLLFLIPAVIIGNWAKSREIGYWPAFFISLFLTPIIGVIVVAVSSKKENPLAQAVQFYQQAQRHMFKKQYAEAIDKYQDALFEIHNSGANVPQRHKHIKMIEDKLMRAREAQTLSMD